MPDEMSQIPITSNTRIGDLLARHPELEDVLVEISPTYQALKNPVLKRTVAKIATLRQVAQVGSIPLSTLIGRLRCAVGHNGGSVDDEAAAPVIARPDWVRDEPVVQSFDAREVIESGGHPMERVMKDLAGLKAGNVYELVTPFVPA